MNIFSVCKKYILRLLKLVRKIVKLPFSLVRLFFGVRKYKQSKSNDSATYLAMIDAFSITGGITNDLVSIMLRHPPYHFERSGLLGSPSCSEVATRLSDLRQKGYLVFSGLLSQATCEELVKFALSVPGYASEMDEGIVQQPPHGLYNRLNPTSTRFIYNPSVIIENPIIQKLLTDNSLLSLAQDYLGGAPIVDIISMWWSSSYKSTPDKEAAQYWHFDMDRPKWLKVFFYLTEVDRDNGPHSFIEGTHRNGGIPFQLRSKGYVRLTDKEVDHHFASEQIMEFTGSKGTVIIEDTRGLHRGRHVTIGDRLVLQFQYCSSLFGGSYAPIIFPVSTDESFRKQREETPIVFQAFH